MAQKQKTKSNKAPAHTKESAIAHINPWTNGGLFWVVFAPVRV